MTEAYEVTIEMVDITDAAHLLTYAQQVGSETEFLSFGSDGLEITEEQEKLYIQSVHDSDNQMMFVAKIDQTIIAVGSIGASSKEKFKHVGELGVSVLQEYWGQGLGSHLVSELLFWAKEYSPLERIELDVVANNLPAIRLYEKFGFVEEGRFKKAIRLHSGYQTVIRMAILLDKE